MTAKPFYLSKTLWVNLIAIVAIIVQAQLGYVIDPNVQIEMLAVINLVLRAVTGEGLDVAGVNLAKMTKK